MPYRKSHRLSRESKAILFSLFLLSVLIVSIVTIFASAGPIVLGTELNTNGYVEYLCLGRACEGHF